MSKKTFSWKDVLKSCEAIALAIRNNGREYSHVKPILRGGAVPATILSGLLNIPVSNHITGTPLIVDDIVDSGDTLKAWKDYDTAALVAKPHSKFKPTFYVSRETEWIEFPWELPDVAEDNEGLVTRLLEIIGEDPTREGLVDTPKRYIKALLELTNGYRQDEKEIYKATFSSDNDELVVVPRIQFYSLCEHHMLPFFGQVHIGYVPNGKVLGLSKFSRLVNMYAHRLQIQEQFADQLSHSIMNNLHPLGAGVVVEANHLCVASRGVKQPNSGFITSCLLGILRTSTRDEFLRLLRL